MTDPVIIIIMSSIRCKSCGSPIENVDADYLVCRYCGSRQVNENGRIKTTGRPQQPRSSGLRITHIIASVGVVIILAVTAGIIMYINPKTPKAQKVSILDVIRYPAAACGVIQGGEGLVPGQQLSSCDKRFTLVMQYEGNLVLYMGKTPLWATDTVGRKTASAIMQRDGNFVLYDADQKPLWATSTRDDSGAYIAVQNDGNLVLCTASGRPIWASHTCCH